MEEKACCRCGDPYIDPTPEVINPRGIHEIMCVEWCPACNSLVGIIHRDGSAHRWYRLYKNRIAPGVWVDKGRDVQQLRVDEETYLPEGLEG